MKPDELEQIKKKILEEAPQHLGDIHFDRRQNMDGSHRMYYSKDYVERVLDLALQSSIKIGKKEIAEEIEEWLSDSIDTSLHGFSNDDLFTLRQVRGHIRYLNQMAVIEDER